jgi:RNA polymerase sigma factor (sigma-70 family)
MLLHAVEQVIDRFDWRRGFRFNSYLTRAVRREIIERFRNLIKQRGKEEAIEPGQLCRNRFDLYKADSRHHEKVVDEKDDIVFIKKIIDLIPDERDQMIVRSYFLEGMDATALSNVHSLTGSRIHQVLEKARNHIAKLSLRARNSNLTIPDYGLIMPYDMTLDRFLKQQWPNNAYVLRKGFDDLYLRKGIVYIYEHKQAYHVLTIANIVASCPGNKAFGRLVDDLKARNLAIYVENVHNERFADKLRKDGWEEVNKNLGAPNFIANLEATTGVIVAE